MIRKIRLGDINPFLRVVRIHTLKQSFKTGLRYNPHYQLHYVFDGVGDFYIDGNTYTAKKGELVLWAPGQVHSISVSNLGAMTVAGIQFDFTRNFSTDHYFPIFYNKDTFSDNMINEVIEFTNFKGFSPYIKVKNPVIIEALLRQAEKYFLEGSRYCEEKASATIKAFFIQLADESILHTPAKPSDKSHDALMKYINQHFHQNLSNHQLSKTLGYHPVHLNRIVLSLTGMSLHQYIIKLRINEALHLLQITNLPINVIAEKVGYTNPQYFSRLFSSKTGYPPTYFRK